MTDTENNLTEKASLPIEMKIIISIALLAVIVILTIYFSNFHVGFGKQENFGQFGDFVGGVLNPFLTFLTIFLLIWSISIQMRELKLTRKELKLTRTEIKHSADALDSAQKAHHKNYELQLNEVKRVQLQHALDEQYAEFKSSWKLPLVTMGGSASTLSFEDIFDLHKHPKSSSVRAIVSSVYGRMNGDPKYEYDVVTINFRDLKSSLRRICQFTEEIYKNIESPPIASALHTKASSLNHKLLSINVITDKEFNINKSRIRLPNKLNDLLH